MTKKIPIRNKELPKNPRVFDVTVNEAVRRLVWVFFEGHLLVARNCRVS